MKQLYDKILMNILLYIVCELFAFGLVQHHALFYSFPPDFSTLISVPVQAYFVLALILFIAIKLANYIADRAEMLED